MRANATDGEKLEEALAILSIAIPLSRPWTNEPDEVKLRIYRNMAEEKSNGLLGSTSTRPKVGLSEEMRKCAVPESDT